jgi:hypothetical protein
MPVFFSEADLDQLKLVHKLVQIDVRSARPQPPPPHLLCSKQAMPQAVPQAMPQAMQGTGQCTAHESQKKNSRGLTPDACAKPATLRMRLRPALSARRRRNPGRKA